MPEMRLAKDRDLVQALAAKRANKTLSDSVLPGRTGTDRPVENAHRPHTCGEDLPVGPVVVAHQLAWRRGPGKDLGNLLGQPLRRRMSCHFKPQQLPVRAENLNPTIFAVKAIKNRTRVKGADGLCWPMEGGVQVQGTVLP
jgi:hypothetical protein